MLRGTPLLVYTPGGQRKTNWNRGSGGVLFTFQPQTVWKGNWSVGWTSFIQTHDGYLAYKVGDGSAAIDRFQNGAQGVVSLWKGNWSSGWTSFELLYPSDTNPVYLGYK